MVNVESEIDGAAAIRAIEQRVGPRPASYKAFVIDLALSATRYFRRGAERWSIFFYRASFVLDEIPVSVVSEDEALLVIGDVGPLKYVLQARTGRLYLWDPDENDKLQLVAAHIDHFFRDLEPELPPPEDPLRVFATEAPVETIDALLDSEPDQDRVTAVAEHAAKAGRIEVVVRCMRRGCRTDRLLSFAIRGGRLPVVRFLIETVGLDPTSALNLRVISTPEVRGYLEERSLRTP